MTSRATFIFWRSLHVQGFDGYPWHHEDRELGTLEICLVNPLSSWVSLVICGSPKRNATMTGESVWNNMLFFVVSLSDPKYIILMSPWNPMFCVRHEHSETKWKNTKIISSFVSMGIPGSWIMVILNMQRAVKTSNRLSTNQRTSGYLNCLTLNFQTLINPDNIWDHIGTLVFANLPRIHFLGVLISKISHAHVSLWWGHVHCLMVGIGG